jgi:membrane-associated phospholipid phosphatase
VLPIQARLLWQHIAVSPVSISDYYIGFPSMHVAMPVIALWYIRQQKQLFGVLIVFDLLIVLGVLLLEWHYFLDILGGIAVAVAAIAVTRNS